MRVMVIDDSAFVRRIVADIINSDPEMTVVGMASDGLEALRKIPEFHPDVVTLDVVMPHLDGIAVLKQLMKSNPLPVIMLSSETREGAELTFEALEYGAIDFVAKPFGKDLPDMSKIKDELLAKIKVAASTRMQRLREQKHVSTVESKQKMKEKVVAIGASTGGPAALETVLPALPEDTPPILVVQHMPSSFTKHFAERLNKLCKFEVKEAEEGDSIIQGRALVAPGGCHMIVTDGRKIHLDMSPPINYVRPSVDPLMETTANFFLAKTVGVLLTGMGKDGAQGMKTIKASGGTTIVQDEESCIVFGMPKAAIELKCVDKTLPLSEIPQEIVRCCEA